VRGRCSWRGVKKGVGVIVEQFTIGIHDRNPALMHSKRIVKKSLNAGEQTSEKNFAGEKSDCISNKKRRASSFPIGTLG